MSRQRRVAQYQLLPSRAGLNRRHPQLRVELEVSDRLADLARDGVNIAIRTAANLPGTVVAREIGSLGRALYAAPAYLAGAGAPDLQGLGIGRLATLVAEPLVLQGRLVPVLPTFVDVQPVPIYAVIAGARQRLPKIKACIDYWADWFGR